MGRSARLFPEKSVTFEVNKPSLFIINLQNIQLFIGDLKYPITV